MEFPCRKCIVRAICKNYSCELLEEYLTHVYRNFKVLSKDEYEEFDKIVPTDFKRIIKNFDENKILISMTEHGHLEKEKNGHLSRIEFIINSSYMVHKTVGEEIKIVYLK